MLYLLWIYQRINKNIDGITYGFPIGDMLNSFMDMYME
jgi:hypothetical protein